MSTYSLPWVLELIATLRSAAEDTIHQGHRNRLLRLADQLEAMRDDLEFGPKKERRLKVRYD